MLGQAKTKRDQSPAYVADLGQNVWRIVVPIRGRLSAAVLAPNFVNRAEAIEWLHSEAGVRCVTAARQSQVML